MKLLPLFFGILISGCSVSEINRSPDRQTVVVEGVEIAVVKINTKEYHAARERPTYLIIESHAFEMLIMSQAIEKASGCKIVTAAFNSPFILQAIVKC